MSGWTQVHLQLVIPDGRTDEVVAAAIAAALRSVSPARRPSRAMWSARSRPGSRGWQGDRAGRDAALPGEAGQALRAPASPIAAAASSETASSTSSR